MGKLRSLLDKKKAKGEDSGKLSSGAGRLSRSEVKLTAEEIAKEAESLGFIVGDVRGGRVNNSSTSAGDSSYIPLSYTAPNGRTIRTEVRVSDHGTGPIRSGNYLHVQSMEDASKVLSSLEQKKLETESLQPLKKQFAVNQPDSKSRKFVDNKGLNEDQLLQLSQARSYEQAKEILLSAPNLDKQQIDSIEKASDFKISQAVGYAINKNKNLAATALVGGSLAASYSPDTEAGIRGYHGSPAKFDQFSDEFMGTGEGAQAYGRGHYLGEVEDTARTYRDALSFGNKIIVDGKEFEDPFVHGGDRISPIGALVTAKGDKNKAIENLKREIQSLEQRIAEKGHGVFRSQLLKKLKSSLAELRQYRDVEIKPKRGYIYETDVDADLDDLIDYDLPLSQQSQKVQEVMHPSGLLTQT